MARGSASTAPWWDCTLRCDKSNATGRKKVEEAKKKPAFLVRVVHHKFYSPIEAYKAEYCAVQEGM